MFCFQNGVASSFPYLASWLIAIVASVVADLLLEKKIASIVVVRKIFTTFGRPLLLTRWDRDKMAAIS